MEQLNRIELRGNVGTIRINKVSDNQVANFTLATNYVHKSREGQPIMETTWFNVVAWGGKGMPADLNEIQKGSFLTVLGRMREVHYTTVDGVEKSSMEVVASKVTVENPYQAPAEK